jgi:hypothetical protein
VSASPYVFEAMNETVNLPSIRRRSKAGFEARGDDRRAVSARKTFQASVEARAPGGGEFVFYDGPPFANGLPHYGHLVTGFVKDIVPRYQTMRGRRVERRFGWDCHGCRRTHWGLSSAQARDILKCGVAFNELPQLGDAVPERLGVLRQPRGALGRFRERLQDDGPLLHGEHHVGLQTALGQRADLRGLPGRPLFLGGADAAVEFRDATRRFLPHAPGPGADRRFKLDGGRKESSRLDDDAWTLPSTWPAVHPDADYAMERAASD